MRQWPARCKRLIRRTGLGGEFFDAVVAALLTIVESRPEIGTTVSADGQTRRALVAGSRTKWPTGSPQPKLRLWQLPT